MNNATLIMIKALQHQRYSEIYQYFTAESKCELVRLHLDIDGLIRCDGRINNAQLADNADYPYLTKQKCNLTSLLISDT